MSVDAYFEGQRLSTVQTVTGAVDVAEIGPTLPNEHVLIDHMRDNWMVTNLLSDPVLAERELACARDAGVAVLVDQTGRGVERDPLVLRDISERTGVRIITGTGWIMEHSYELDFDRTGANALAALIVRDLDEGIDDTGVRAGIIGEISVHARWVSPREERMLRAAARAQASSGAPLAVGGTHISTAMDQLDILEDEGVDLQKVVVNHVNDSAHGGSLCEIIDRGSFICFDSFPTDSSQLLKRDAAAIADLAQGQEISQLLVSTGVRTRRQLANYGGEGYGFAFTAMRDLLMDAGVTREQWEQISVLNPRRLLARQDGR